MNILGIDFEDWFHPQLIKKNLKDEKHEARMFKGLEKIIENLNCLSRNIRYDDSVVRIGIRSLLDKGYIKQDGRDTVDWDDLEATFYTKPEKREEIDRRLREFRWGRGRRILH